MYRSLIKEAMKKKSDLTSEVTARIQAEINKFRDQAEALIDQAEDLESALENWHYESLVEEGLITQAEADQLWKDLERVEERGQGVPGDWE